jgi:hypothetical protein
MCQNLQQNITPGSDSHFMKQGEKIKTNKGTHSNFNHQKLPASNQNYVLF